MRRTLSLLLAAALLSLAFAPAPLPPRPEKKALPASLCGKWAYEIQNVGGLLIPVELRDRIWIEIEPGSFSRCSEGHRSQSRLILEPELAPKGFTLEFTHPLTGRTTRMLGIYRLAGDRLTLCYDNTGKSRPTRFEVPPSREEVVLSVLRRLR
jgi:uncharacterized protein (TIGR03067 family)